MDDTALPLNFLENSGLPGLDLELTELQVPVCQHPNLCSGCCCTEAEVFCCRLASHVPEIILPQFRLQACFACPQCALRPPCMWSVLRRIWALWPLTAAGPSASRLDAYRTSQEAQAWVDAPMEAQEQATQPLHPNRPALTMLQDNLPEYAFFSQPNNVVATAAGASLPATATAAGTSLPATATAAGTSLPATATVVAAPVDPANGDANNFQQLDFRPLGTQSPTHHRESNLAPATQQDLNPAAVDHQTGGSTLASASAVTFVQEHTTGEATLAADRPQSSLGPASEAGDNIRITAMPIYLDDVTQGVSTCDIM